MKDYAKPKRISINMVNDLKEVSLVRINKGLADPFKKNETSLREITDLVTRTESWKNVLKELRSKPKRK